MNVLNNECEIQQKEIIMKFQKHLLEMEGPDIFWGENRLHTKQQKLEWYHTSLEIRMKSMEFQIGILYLS